MSPYLKLLLLSGCVPFILSFWPPLRIWRYPRALAFTLSLIIFIFGSWDIFATWRGHWSFAPAGVFATRIINLPLEEVLFFAVIPFCCIFTWEVINYLKQKVK